MDSVLAIIETMRAQGQSDADILAVVEATVKAKSKRQERNRRYYEKRLNKTPSDSDANRLNKTQNRLKPSETVLKASESDEKGSPVPPYDIKNSTPLSPSKNIQNGREAFFKFREAYPRREGANPWTPAEKKFIQLVKAGIDPAEIIAGAKAYRNSVANSDAKFVAQAVTWLNQQRWRDEKPMNGNLFDVVSTRIFVLHGSPQWEAWTRHLGKPKPTTQRGQEVGWYFDTEWPPDGKIISPFAMAVGNKANGKGSPTAERDIPWLQGIIHGQA